MISLLIYVLVLALIFGVVFWVIGLLPLPEPFGTIARVVVGLIFLLVLINFVLGLPGYHGPALLR